MIAVLQGCSGSNPAPARPPVIVYLIDTLRADRLGSWGYARDTSPTLDRLAATGVRFARHLSQSSWTKCSLASLWTGLYPARAGVTRFDHVTSSEAAARGAAGPRRCAITASMSRRRATSQEASSGLWCTPAV